MQPPEIFRPRQTHHATLQLYFAALTYHYIKIFKFTSHDENCRFGAVQLPRQYAFIYLMLQHMEQLLPEFCKQSDQDNLPACLTFSGIDFG